MAWMIGLKFILLVALFAVSSCSKDNTGSSSAEDLSKNQNKTDASSKTVVRIGVADACQEPLTFEDGSGISFDIISALNQIQSKYEFTHEFLPTKRLENLSQNGKIHIAAFSNLSWGWDQNKVSRSTDLIADKDVFFTLKKDGRDHSYFDDIPSKLIAGVKGFHYNFNKVKTNSENEKKPPRFIGVYSEKSVVDMVILERAEIGVVSIFTLQYLFMTDPQKYAKLLISEKYDSEYERYYVLNESSPIKAEEINSFLAQIKKEGVLQKIFEKYGLQKPAIAGK
ncbi:MAG: ABC transporter substrate-binding protein [Lentisphaeraceae bacterium]|nr:ABC transporter substrate-binding protein [Lentisphaeraceae bacterium]